MSTLSGDVSNHGSSIRNVDSFSSVAELEDIDFSRLPRPRHLNVERQGSLERSLTDTQLGFSPHPPSRAENFFRALDHFDGVFSPSKRSGFTTPRSPFGPGPNPMIAEAWEALRRTLVHFRGQPVGTIAALDNSDEKLNYDQVMCIMSL